MASHDLFGLRGFVIDAPEFGSRRAHRDGALIVEDGKIVAVGSYDDLRRSERGRELTWSKSPAVAIFPGLVDCHTHLPQYPVVARGQSELLPWLRENIFPIERESTGPKARAEAPRFFQELARNGTTTAMVYAAIYEDSCEAAFQAAEESGLRVIMGKMMMDLGSYGGLQRKKILSVSLLEGERLCQKWHGAADGRLQYAFSPRFAMTCSEKLMRSAAELAKKYGAYVQTHLAENQRELEKVRNLFMWARDYTDVYDQCGLLTSRTVLGNCIHLSEREVQTLAAAQASVAHCPTSNFFLGSGIMKLDELRQAGLAIGLGSDVAAGPELNMWQVMRSAIEGQRARGFYKPEVAPLRAAEAFYLATAGGARALEKTDVMGTLAVGQEADVVVVDLESLLPYGAEGGALARMSAEDVLALCIYRGGPEATRETYLRGRCVYRKPEAAARV